VADLHPLDGIIGRRGARCTLGFRNMVGEKRVSNVIRYHLDPEVNGVMWVRA